MADDRTIPTREKFLECLSRTCNVTRSCREAEVSRDTIYRWRDEDPAFAAAWDAAKKRAVEALEDETHRRAFEGNEEPILNVKGEIVGYRLAYSDRLAEFLLKAHAPHKYRERSSVELTGKDGGPMQQSVSVQVVSGVPEAVAFAKPLPHLGGCDEECDLA